MQTRLIMILLAAISVTNGANADSTQAQCEIHPLKENTPVRTTDCTFSQRQGYITISREDGVTHDLKPDGATVGRFVDQDDQVVYRQSGLGDQGLIFKMPTERVFVYWARQESTQDNWTAPFTTDDYDATTRLRCRASTDQEFGSCPAGILRMDDGQASIVVQNQLGHQFTINFLSDVVNATNRPLQARLEGDTWTLVFENGEVWEVPLAAIEGG